MVPVKAVVYGRVSADAQERDGTSLDTQDRACVEYAQAKGWVAVENIKDTASGSNLDRPGIERVRQLLSQGSDYLVLPTGLLWILREASTSHRSVRPF